MAVNELLQRAIERFWDTIPQVWVRVRNNARANAAQDFNIPLVQFHILRHIHKGIHSVAELAECQQISRPAISQAVDQLVERGLVTRREDPVDRRYVHLELTGEGSSLISAVFGKNRQWMAEKMANLSPEELETIIRATDILKNTFIPLEE
jgi:DNA-binding MarR family transcriptional regulator